MNGFLRFQKRLPGGRRFGYLDLNFTGEILLEDHLLLQEGGRTLTGSLSLLKHSVGQGNIG